MPAYTNSRDLCTKALVLRRTKYGETDRIISLLTPEGKLDVLARGVRKEKSRLAGGVEMFCLTEVVVHQHRPGQGREKGLATLTSARMLKFYQQILTDLARLELASTALKAIAKVANQVNDPGLFKLLWQILEGLHAGIDLSLVETFYLLNLAKISGEEANLFFDTTGAKLRADETYVWNAYENALAPQSGGPLGAKEIKLMRLIVSTPLEIVGKVRGLSEMLPPVLEMARAVGQSGKSVL